MQEIEVCKVRTKYSGGKAGKAAGKAKGGGGRKAEGGAYRHGRQGQARQGWARQAQQDRENQAYIGKRAAEEREREATFLNPRGPAGAHRQVRGQGKSKGRQACTGRAGRL